MRVEWTDQAKEGRKKVADYIRNRFGLRHKKEFIQEVHNTVKLLLRNPNLGPIDPLFTDRRIAYRSTIVNGLSKMVYFIDGDTIYIAAFWDTRQEPEAQAAQVKE